VISGRWAPIDSFEHDGMLYVIAQRNTAETQKRNALTKREQAVLALTAQGLPNKCIAYDQEISQASVSTTLTRLRARLNARSAAELARVLWVLRPAECLPTTTGVGYWAIDRQEYLTFSRAPAKTASVAVLTAGEREVFQAVIAGLSTAAISAMRGSSARTLANQLGSIFRKLNVGSRAEMRARYAHCHRELVRFRI
jgi:DNA-binding CsgD family transcriptional regulator